jgi:hypothetical protein
MTKKTTRKTAEIGTGRGQAAKGRGAKSKPAGVGKAAATATLEGPSHDRIAARAREIWEKRGCPYGQDEKIWLEAEEQLRREMEERGGIV